MQENKILNEDEIDLRELFKTIWDKRFFIIIFTFIITLISFIYVLLKNPTPVYEGILSVQIGDIQSENFGNKIIETPQNLSYILEVEFKVNPNIVKGTTSILEIKYSNEDKARIKTILEDVKNFIITKHENDTSFYKNKIMTKQIGDIKISEEAMNKPKTALIVTVAFITGFILSIFLLFFIQFIQSIKRVLNSFYT
ncbi:Wzz/FepE/Etk N-terminal domain-containing protein [Aliarcobacter cryaerophilus]|uniref:Wzz/FepE/Etk N-terminal domain-containing protein n=1 Tax=Aliarcobacter cryaerophilus TaxID=28198 RepID=UPI0021B2B86D|nr:Wzz/FepE/Etk N-terminal domain-containing protein [Aliarcobacter cryaerophilus]MCT7433808.1 Wzz/FepE/Etk N-terminal domain-containing protein [Aliarcobacter cryaerophilus]